jgi:hypothetical protein
MNRKRDIPVAIRLLFPTALAVAGLTGCTTTNNVRPEQIQRLDGYEAWLVPQPIRLLETVDGGKVSFRNDANLYLEVPGSRVGGRFESIRVRDGNFAGRTTDGQQIQTPLHEVAGAEIVRVSPAKTAVLIGGLIVVLLGAFLLVPHVSEPMVGRALRVGGKIVASPLADTDGWRTGGLHPETRSLSPDARAAIAAAWARSAQSEHASVPAFSRLSLSLVALGAPARLVEGAHRAALEEIEHARLSFTLAEAYAAGVPVAPGPLAELLTAPAVTVTTLSELACESLIDGCLLEGVAAAFVWAAHTRAVDPAVRQVLATIGRDEASHAELAWDVVTWCCEQSDADLRRRLMMLVRRQRPARPPVDVTPGLSVELEAHGWPGPAVWRDLFERTRAAVIARLERLLFDASSRRSIAQHAILAVDEQSRSGYERTSGSGGVGNA